MAPAISTTGSSAQAKLATRPGTACSRALAAASNNGDGGVAIPFSVVANSGPAIASVGMPTINP